jgi:hypothetical protein
MAAPSILLVAFFMDVLDPRLLESRTLITACENESLEVDNDGTVREHERIF